MHAFAGIGDGEASLKRCYELASRPVISQGWRKCKRLIIDEISMVDGEYFDVSFLPYLPLILTILSTNFNVANSRKSRLLHDTFAVMTNHSVAYN